jgi:hypothetical protein
VDYNIVSEEEGTRIEVFTEKKAAVAVRSDGQERIYLPVDQAENSSYYVDEPSKLVLTEKGYTVVHPGEVSEVEVFSK